MTFDPNDWDDFNLALGAAFTLVGLLMLAIWLTGRVHGC